MFGKFARTAISAVCCLSLLCPAFAQDQITSVSTTPPVTSAESKILDVALTTDGVMQGQVLSEQGQAIDGAKVVISQKQVKLLETTTNAAGLFGVVGMKSGLYQIDSPGKSQIVRVWSHQIAPENSKQVATLVQNNATVRGQFGYIDPINATALALGIAGVALSAVTLDKINNLEDQTAANQASLNKLVNKLASP